jgi:protein-tyrosine phosphatase
MSTDSTYTLLFVCMGNICRSPTAHAVIRQRLRAEGLSHQVVVDSAGTHNYHPGASPDARSQRHALRRGYDLSDLRARQIAPDDFAEADLILAMDWENLALLQAICPQQHAAKLRRLTDFCTRHAAESVPDPYYSGDQGFEFVLDLIEDAADGLLGHIRAELQRAH